MASPIPNQRGVRLVPRPSVLSLFSGIGLLDLGVGMALPGSRVACYVEREAFAAAVLVARMREGALPRVPVWADVSTFNARRWRGEVDLVVGGYPCVGHSVAGKRQGFSDPRSALWHHFARVVEECEPALVFVENVSALVRSGLGRVLRDLSSLGYDASWDHFTAAEVGAPHRRSRLFLLAWRSDVAHAHGFGAGEPRPEPLPFSRGGPSRQDAGERGELDVADSDRKRLVHVRRGWQLEAGQHQTLGHDAHGRGGEGPVANSASGGCDSRIWGELATTRRSLDLDDSEESVADSFRSFVWDQPGRGRGPRGSRSPFPPGPSEVERWAGPQPSVRLPLDGRRRRVEPTSPYAFWRDQLRALGNGVVPQQAARAFRVLWERAFGFPLPQEEA